MIIIKSKKGLIFPLLKFPLRLNKILALLVFSFQILNASIIALLVHTSQYLFVLQLEFMVPLVVVEALQSEVKQAVVYVSEASPWSYVQGHYRA